MKFVLIELIAAGPMGYGCGCESSLKALLWWCFPILSKSFVNIPVV